MTEIPSPACTAKAGRHRAVPHADGRHQHSRHWLLEEGDSIHPDYDTVALRDVARLYAKYDALYKAAAIPAPDPAPAKPFFAYPRERHRVVRDDAGGASLCSREPARVPPQRVVRWRVVRRR